MNKPSNEILNITSSMMKALLNQGVELHNVGCYGYNRKSFLPTAGRKLYDTHFVGNDTVMVKAGWQMDLSDKEELKEFEDFSPLFDNKVYDVTISNIGGKSLYDDTLGLIISDAECQGMENQRGFFDDFYLDIFISHGLTLKLTLNRGMGTFAIKGYIGDECVAMLRRNWIVHEIFDKTYEADSQHRKEFTHCIEAAVNDAKEHNAILVQRGDAWCLESKHDDGLLSFQCIGSFITDELEHIYNNLGKSHDETYIIFAKVLQTALESSKPVKSEEGYNS